jgi:nicotinamide-nucleotide adenylyltransferase
MMKKMGTIGVIGRFKPLHNGAALMLESICEHAEKAIIGIGSANKYNQRNPFTPEETKEMINAHLKGKYTNFTIIYVPDFAHRPEYQDGMKWKEYVIEHFGKLDHFIAGNPYVAGLLKDTYDIIHPSELIPEKKWIMLRATQVRIAIATNNNWQSLVPGAVAEYITEHHLDDRFRAQFGLETIALLSGKNVLEEDYLSEKNHTTET